MDTNVTIRSSILVEKLFPEKEDKNKNTFKITTSLAHTESKKNI